MSLLFRNRTLFYHVLVIISLVFIWNSLLSAAPSDGETSLKEADRLLNLDLEELMQERKTTLFKSESTLLDTPAAIYVLTSEEIKRSGATTIPEVLRHIPGIEVHRVNRNRWAISIRGFNGVYSNKLQVLIDGRSIYTSLFSGVYWDLYDIPLRLIEKIEVIRGPGASVYGSNAVNGVINIITKKHDADCTNGKRENNLSVATGNESSLITSFIFHNQFKNDSGIRLWGKFRDEGSFQNIDGSDATEEWKNHSFGLCYALKRGRDKWSLSSSVFRSLANNHITLPVFELTSLYSDKKSHSDTHAQAFNLNYVHSWSDNRKLSLIISHANEHLKSALIDDERVVYSLESNYSFHPWRNHQLVLGASLKTEDSEVDTKGSFSPYTYITPTGNGSRKDETTSFFFYDTWQLSGKNLVLSLGSKFEKNDYSGSEIQPTARLLGLNKKRDTSWWIAWSQAARTPSRVETILQFPLINFPAATLHPTLPAQGRIFADGSFDAEKMTAVEAGVKKNFKKDTSMELSLFRNKYRDIIKAVSAPTKATPEITPVTRLAIPLLLLNQYSGHTTGFELTYTTKPVDNWRLRGSYSYIDFDFEDIDFGNPAATPNFNPSVDRIYHPQSRFSLHSYLDLKNRWKWDLHFFNIRQIPYLNLESVNKLDTRFSKKLSDRVEVELVGLNLLHEKEEEFADSLFDTIKHTYIERSFMVRVNYKF